MVQQSQTIDRFMSGSKRAGKASDLRNQSAGWSELLKYWYILAGVFLLAYLLSVPVAVLIGVFYIGIGFRAKGMLAKLIIAVGQSFKSPDKASGGFNVAKRDKSARSFQNDAQAMALQAVKNLTTTSQSQSEQGFSVRQTTPQLSDTSTTDFVKSGLATQKAIIDRSSDQKGAANILTWLVYVTLISFSCLLIYAGYNPEFFKPVAWIRHPVQSIYYGAMGLAIVLPLFIYFSFMGDRQL